MYAISALALLLCVVALSAATEKKPDAAEKKPAATTANKSTDEDLKKFFTQNDTNKDGEIKIETAVDFFKTKGVAENKATAALKKHDKDGNGKLTYVAFVAAAEELDVA